MNIFVLDQNPFVAATYHNDVHVSKMLVESCQMLCTAFHYLPFKNNNTISFIPYAPTHPNHPCSIWVRESQANFQWLLKLAVGLCGEFYDRKNKEHASFKVVDWIIQHQYFIDWDLIGHDQTPFAIAMPDIYNTGDAVESYRKYHIEEKQGFSRRLKNNTTKYYPYQWTKIGVPSWFTVKKGLQAP